MATAEIQETSEEKSFAEQAADAVVQHIVEHRSITKADVHRILEQFGMRSKQQREDCIKPLVNAKCPEDFLPIKRKVIQFLCGIEDALEE